MPKKKILVTVLNWGLGHATRCIPVIKAIQEQGFEPIIASDGAALQLLRKEFPLLKNYRLPSYKITYPEGKKSLKFHFLMNSPEMARTYFRENKAINEIVEKEEISKIISDNRPGAFSKRIPSAYITHQLQVLSGGTTSFSTKIHQYFIHQFSECWIPDSGGEINLSGRMSHGIKLKIPVRYLGIFSRIEKKDLPEKYKVTVLLSGPEPQRSILEKILLKEFRNFPEKVLFIRGKENSERIVSANKNLEIKNLLFGEELENALNESEFILARSGYSTLMDLVSIQKKAFFIPTPGQFEQHYLAERMERLRIAPFCQQKDFSIDKLEKVNNYIGFRDFHPAPDFSAIFSFLERE